MLFIVLDDTGFGQLGCYGSPIDTPNIDRLAANGLRYTNMHTTALCSPTRSCILTGRNHHSNDMAGITEGSTGFPGYNGYIPFENGFLSEILRTRLQHLRRGQVAPHAGRPDRPRRAPTIAGRWAAASSATTASSAATPTSTTRTWSTTTTRSNRPATPEEGYHLTADLADQAIAFIADAKQVAPNKPFFLYFATGAMHAPHHVPKEWADRYQGGSTTAGTPTARRSSRGRRNWASSPPDAELSRHDPDVQDWDSLSADERRLYARMMEVFAGFLEHTDDQIGRLLDFLEEIGEFDNTLIMLISRQRRQRRGRTDRLGQREQVLQQRREDSRRTSLRSTTSAGPSTSTTTRGAGRGPATRRSAAGSARPTAAASAIRSSSTGRRASLPRARSATQYAHAIDMVPTVLERSASSPDAHPRRHAVADRGRELAYTFDDADAPTRHHTVFRDVRPPLALPRRLAGGLPVAGDLVRRGPAVRHADHGEKLLDLDATGWELYHVAEDPAENHNVAEEHRDRLIEMIGMWYVEAGKYNVLPIDGRGTAALRRSAPGDRAARTATPTTRTPRPSRRMRRQGLQPPAQHHAHWSSPRAAPRACSSRHGGNTGGYAFFVQDGKLHYVHNYVAAQELHVVSESAVPAGTHFAAL